MSEVSHEERIRFLRFVGVGDQQDTDLASFVESRAGFDAFRRIVDLGEKHLGNPTALFGELVLAPREVQVLAHRALFSGLGSAMEASCRRDVEGTRE